MGSIQLRTSILSFAFFLACSPLSWAIPKGFVSLSDVDPSILIEMRYSGPHNFVGKKVTGYESDKCILTEAAASALKKVQADLKKQGLSLKVYDCYRPQRAVNEFVNWAKDLSDTRMKNEFYPEVKKENLFKDGYIDKKSGHSRGSTLDLTVVPIPIPHQPEFKTGDPLQKCFHPLKSRFQDNSLDMGTGFDCFDPRAHTDHPSIEGAQKLNRQLLKKAMEKEGFVNLPVEWWHYTLENEPFPDTYFDFEIR